MNKHYRMKRIFSSLFVAGLILTVVFGAASCRKSARRLLAVDEDSLAYVIGMNIGYNLLQMDSTLNLDAVFAAIRDVYEENPKMTMADARIYYLRQMNYAKYEKFKQYEERFLADVVKNNRSFVQTRTGVTYKVDASGDQQTLASNLRDTVVFLYRLSLQDGTEISPAADTAKLALSDLVKGLQETMKIVGAGGHFDAWIPSDLAYGAGGDEEQGIAPNSTLFYEVDVLEVIPYRRR